jgi:hypothetical protein
MHRLKKYLTGALLGLSAAACQQLPVTDEYSPRSRIPPGSHLVLHRAVALPAGHARVFMQNGQVVAKTKLDIYQPHCNFEVRNVSRGTATIEPDDFVVTAVTEDETEVVHGRASQHYAALGNTVAMGGDVTPMMVTRFIRHALESGHQPEVMRLTCHGGFAEPWQAAYPSIDQIRQSLGDLVTLQMPHTL